jgi:hypothetical protein
MVAEEIKDVDTTEEVKAYKAFKESQLNNRKFWLTLVSMLMVVLIACLAQTLPVLEKLFSEATSTLVLLTLTFTAGNVGEYFIKSRLGVSNVQSKDGQP